MKKEKKKIIKMCNNILDYTGLGLALAGVAAGVITTVVVSIKTLTGGKQMIDQVNPSVVNPAVTMSQPTPQAVPYGMCTDTRRGMGYGYNPNFANIMYGSNNPFENYMANPMVNNYGYNNPYMNNMMVNYGNPYTNMNMNNMMFGYNPYMNNMGGFPNMSASGMFSRYAFRDVPVSTPVQNNNVNPRNFQNINWNPNMNMNIPQPMSNNPFTNLNNVYNNINSYGYNRGYNNNNYGYNNPYNPNVNMNNMATYTNPMNYFNPFANNRVYPNDWNNMAMMMQNAECRLKNNMMMNKYGYNPSLNPNQYSQFTNNPSVFDARMHNMMNQMQMKNTNNSDPLAGMRYPSNFGKPMMPTNNNPMNNPMNVQFSGGMDLANQMNNGNGIVQNPLDPNTFNQNIAAMAARVNYNNKPSYEQSKETSWTEMVDAAFKGSTNLNDVVNSAIPPETWHAVPPMKPNTPAPSPTPSMGIDLFANQAAVEQARLNGNDNNNLV